MMTKIVSALDSLRNFPAGFLLALSIVLGLLVFLPDRIADALAIKDLRSAYRTFLGPSLLLTVSFLLTKLVLGLSGRRKERKGVRDRVDLLRQLTASEKGYLAQFTVLGVNTIYVALGDGVAGGLAAKNIIYQSSSVFNVLEGMPFNLQPWAYEELRQNPELLRGAIGRPLTNQERFLGGRY